MERLITFGLDSERVRRLEKYEPNRVCHVRFLTFTVFPSPPTDAESNHSAIVGNSVIRARLTLLATQN